jgi:hypothetical protein
MSARLALPALALALVAACSTGPAVPDWRLNAAGHVDRYRSAWLEGNERVAAIEFQAARGETARTGRPDWVARVELNRCAVRVASLDFSPCAGFDTLAADATPEERAYARYLAGQAGAADVALLPASQRAVAAGQSDLGAIDDPLARLVAAGVLLRRERITPLQVDEAVATASRWGWSRPLLAWLGVQRRLAEQHGDHAGAARVQRQIDLVRLPAHPAH